MPDSNMSPENLDPKVKEELESYKKSLEGLRQQRKDLYDKLSPQAKDVLKKRHQQRMMNRMNGGKMGDMHGDEDMMNGDMTSPMNQGTSSAGTKTMPTTPPAAVSPAAPSSGGAAPLPQAK